MNTPGVTAEAALGIRTPAYHCADVGSEGRFSNKAAERRCQMNMPGFNADASLYKTNKNYRMVASAVQAATQVVPQAEIANAICGFVGNLCRAGIDAHCSQICDILGTADCANCFATAVGDCESNWLRQLSGKLGSLTEG